MGARRVEGHEFALRLHVAIGVGVDHHTQRAVEAVADGAGSLEKGLGSISLP